MFVHQRTQGLIIKKEDRGESDQLFTIYTKDFGKIEVLGRAIRKISSKLRPGVEIFYLSEIEFIQGKIYKTLTDAILIEKFRNIRKDLDRLKIAYQIAEVLDDLVKGQEKDEKVWDLLREVFNELDNWKLEIIYHYFLWNLFSILGYHFNFYNCSICGKKLLPGKNYLNNVDGGVTDSLCFDKMKSAGRRMGKEISPETIKILRLILRKDWQTLTKIKQKSLHIDSIASISENYFNCLTNKVS